VDGIRLNADQYDRFVQLTNEVDGSSNGGRLPGDFGYDAGDTLLGALNSLVDATSEAGEVYSTMSDDDRYQEMSNIVATRRKNARLRLKKEFPDLEFRTMTFE
jgi:hypothetical protein